MLRLFGRSGTELPLQVSVVRISPCRRVSASRRYRRQKMKKLLTMLALGGSMILLSACNTVEGAGKDAEYVGDCADGVKGNC